MPAPFHTDLGVLWDPLPGGGRLLTGGKGAAEVPGLTPAPGPADRSPRTCLRTRIHRQLFSLRSARPRRVSDTRLPAQLAEPRHTWLCRRSGLQIMRKVLPRSRRKWKRIIILRRVSLHGPDMSLSGRKAHSWSRRGDPCDPRKLVSERKPLRGIHLKQTLKAWPVWLGGLVSSYVPKRCQFNSQSGHVPRFLC